MKIERTKLSLAIIALGLCSSAFAQNNVSTASTSSQGNSPAELSAVTIFGHYDNAVGSSDAASQGAIRGELLQDIPLLRPGETLETVPGLVVTQHSGDGKANQFFLRGYNLDHGTDFATSIDGVLVNMPTNAHGQGYCDVNFLIPELVDHINYRKGPYFADTGDFSSAGSANIEYRKRLDQNIFNLTGGSYGYRRAVMAVSTNLTPQNPESDGAYGQTGPVLLGALEIQHTNGPWSIPENLNKYNGLLRLSDGSKANGWTMDGIYYNATWNATDQVPLSLINSGQLGRFSSLSPSDGGATERAIVSGEWHNVDDKGFARVSTFLEHYRLQLWSDFTFNELRPATGDQFEQEENRNIFGAQAIKGWNHSLFDFDSISELGVQLRHDNIKVGTFFTEKRARYATLVEDFVRETMISLYLQNTTTWNSWFRTQTGLRGDHVMMSLNSYTTPENNGSASATKVSPKLSLIFGPWQKTELFLNAGRGFHSNDARGVIDKVIPGTTDPATPNPALISSMGKEIGVRTGIIDSLQSSIALWSLNSKSEITYSADDGTSQPNGASKRYGLEWNNHWTPNRWLLIDADMAWSHARFSNMNDNGDVGNHIPNAVNRVGLFRTAIHDIGAWSGEVETRFIGSYPLSQDGTTKAPPAIVTNLRVQRKITTNAALSLDVLNLFNREYFDIAYQQDYRITPTSTLVPNGVTVHPGEPREFRLTLQLRY